MIKTKNREYWDVNNLHGWTMLQKLPVNWFKWVEYSSQFNEDFIKSCNEENEERFFIWIWCSISLKKLHHVDNDLSLLPERLKIEKVEKFVANVHDKSEDVIHIRNLKQALNSGLVLKKVQILIRFNQKAWLKPNIDKNTDLRKEAKNDFEKTFPS